MTSISSRSRIKDNQRECSTHHHNVQTRSLYYTAGRKPRTSPSPHTPASSAFSASRLSPISGCCQNIFIAHFGIFAAITFHRIFDQYSRFQFWAVFFADPGEFEFGLFCSLSIFPYLLYDENNSSFCLKYSVSTSRSSF